MRTAPSRLEQRSTDCPEEKRERQPDRALGIGDNRAGGEEPEQENGWARRERDGKGAVLLVGTGQVVGKVAR